MHHANPTATKSKRRPLGFILLALLSAFFVLFSACSPGNDDDAAPSMDSPADDMAVPAATEAMSDAGEAMEEAPEPQPADEPRPAAISEDSGLAVPTALTPADLGRDIIYRATIEVQADDVAAANREAVAIVQGLGGIVFSQATRTEPRPRTEITFKVLPADFSTALERLAGVGKLIDQEITSDDVTEIIVDHGKPHHHRRGQRDPPAEVPRGGHPA